MAQRRRQKPDRAASPPTALREPVRSLTTPVFAQPEPTPDPSTFKITHPSDNAAYKLIDELNKEHKIHPLPFPLPRGGEAEPQLSLLQVFGGNAAAIQRIEGNGQLVFHATGDCGSTRGPATQNEVTDKMIADFTGALPAETPQFALLLGDVVYNFGESQYYYDQFYEPYRNYSAPVLAVAGNHDGMVSPLAHATSLAAYLRNFCADPSHGYTVTPEAGGLSRTAQIQPGVFFTFDAPFVRILVLYSNTLEDPGVISDANIGSAQLDYLKAALARIKQEKFAGAVLFAHHHPPYAAGGQHSSSVQMRQQMDAVCAQAGVWPHAVLAGHAHNYQRFTRHRPDGSDIPYIVCGNGGHNVQKLRSVNGTPLRAPQLFQAAAAHDDAVTFENYDDTDYGYLRVIANARQLRIEYHPASDGSGVKAPDDSVTIDLKTRQQSVFAAKDLGMPARAQQIHSLLAAAGAGAASARKVRAKRRR